MAERFIGWWERCWWGARRRGRRGGPARGTPGGGGRLGDRGASEDRLHHRVGEGDPNGGDLLIVPRRVDAVAQENDEHVVRRVNPERRAGESGGPERDRRQVVPRRVVAGGRVPSEGSRGARAVRPRRER